MTGTTLALAPWLRRELLLYADGAAKRLDGRPSSNLVRRDLLRLAPEMGVGYYRITAHGRRALATDNSAIMASEMKEREESKMQPPYETGVHVNVVESAHAGGGAAEDHTQLTLLLAGGGPFAPDEECLPVMLVPGNTPHTVKAVLVERGILCGACGAAKDGTGSRQPCPIDDPVHEWVEGWVMRKPEGSLGPMFNGRYIAASDDRFTETVERITGHPFDGAVPLHDRYETPAQYASYD